RHYGGGRALPGRSWTVIAWAGIMTMIRKRVFIGLLLISMAPFIVVAGRAWVAANYPQMSMLAPSAETFRQYLEWQGFFIFLITVWAGAGLIANDRRANALQIYLSKPLMRSEYIAGKLAVLFGFLIPAITIGSLIQVSVAAFLMLALSSLSKSARYVGILYVGITFFTSAIYAVLYAITGSSRIAWISINNNVLQVVDVVFRLKPRYAVPWQVSLLVIIAVVVVSISILERRVRGVEVVT